MILSFEKNKRKVNDNENNLQNHGLLNNTSYILLKKQLQRHFCYSNAKINSLLIRNLKMKLTKGQEAETEILKLWIFLTDEHDVSVCILCVHVYTR